MIKFKLTVKFITYIFIYKCQSTSLLLSFQDVHYWKYVSPKSSSKLSVLCCRYQFKKNCNYKYQQFSCNMLLVTNIADLSMYIYLLLHFSLKRKHFLLIWLLYFRFVSTWSPTNIQNGNIEHPASEPEQQLMYPKVLSHNWGMMIK